jgi:hypothetical protein
MNRKLLLLSAGTLAVGAGSMATLTYSTNCGGNCAALAQIRMIALAARVGSMDAPDGSFGFATADPAAHPYFADASRPREARFLVTTETITGKTSPPIIIAVCDTPYRNLPEQWFGTPPPTHAAAFSDGTSRLISTPEFAALDFSKLIPLDQLYPPNPSRTP